MRAVLVAAGAAGVAAALLGAGPAGAAPALKVPVAPVAPGEHPPVPVGVQGGYLQLKVVGEGIAPASPARAGGADAGRPIAAVTLHCPAEPGVGNHPHAASACTALQRVNGDLSKLPAAKGRVCPMIFSPVKGEADGVWNGRRVSFATTASNRCELNAKLAPVFDF